MAPLHIYTYTAMCVVQRRRCLTFKKKSKIDPVKSKFIFRKLTWCIEKLLSCTFRVKQSWSQIRDYTEFSTYIFFSHLNLITLVMLISTDILFMHIYIYIYMLFINWTFHRKNFSNTPLGFQHLSLYQFLSIAINTAFLQCLSEENINS